MLPALVFWLVLLSFLLLSLWLRSKRLKGQWRYVAGEMAGDPAFSPLAQAVANLVSAAGGIYVSGQLLLQFLHSDVPQVVIQGNSVDLLAFLSLWAAILQPIVFKLLGLFRHK